MTWLIKIIHRNSFELLSFYQTTPSKHINMQKEACIYSWTINSVLWHAEENKSGMISIADSSKTPKQSDSINKTTGRTKMCIFTHFKAAEHYWHLLKVKQDGYVLFCLTKCHAGSITIDWSGSGELHEKQTKIFASELSFSIIPDIKA